MPSPRPARSPILALLFVLMIAPPVTMGLALPWLMHQPRSLALLLSGAVAVLTVASSIALAVLYDGRVDEWHRSNTRFSSHWGWTVGACVGPLLLILPPVQNLILSGAALWGGMPDPDPRLVLTTFAFGLIALVLIQTVCTLLLSIGWTLWMSRGARDLP